VEENMYTETQLSKLIEDVEREFTAHLAKAEGASGEALLKSEEPPKEKPKEDPKKEEQSKEAPQAEAKPEAKPAEGQEQPQAAPAAEESHGYDDEDLNHLNQMYGSMSKAELKLHHDVVKSQLDKCMGATMGKSESEVAGGIGGHRSENPPQPTVKGANLDSDPANGGIEGQEPNNSPGAKSPASDANGAKINASPKKLDKSEHARRNGGEITGQEPNNSPGAKSPASKAQGVQMEKSENQELELLKGELADKTAKLEELQKNYGGVAEFLTRFVAATRKAPEGKAITSLEPIAKSEGSQEDKTLTKAEVHSILCEKTKDPTLKKSDRDAINTYYDRGQVDIKSINHLLK
jgi:hypothetical protein